MVSNKTKGYKGVVDASEILAKIEGGRDVNCKDVVIKGDLEISKPIVTSEISIVNCRIDGFVIFSNEVFQKHVNFSRTIFNGRYEREFSHFLLVGVVSGSKGCYPIGRGPLSVRFRPTPDWGPYNVFGDLWDHGESALKGDEQASKESDQANVPPSIHIERTRFEGLANFKETLFNGDADFGNAAFGTAYFSNATFKGNAYFCGAKFEGFADFLGVFFEKEANFMYAQFVANVAFFGATFKGLASFDDAQFTSHTIFLNTKFEGIANFKKARFDAADFQRCEFNDARFLNTISKNKANFAGCEFNDARFLNTIFKNKANFAEDNFKGITNFSRSQFEGIASFKLAKFEGNTDFKGAKFCKTISFIRGKFAEIATFVGAMFDRSLLLDSSKINSMNLSDVILGQNFRISLKNSDFANLRIHWKIIQDRFKYDGAAYLALIKNYNNLEWFEDADQCYYQYRFQKGKLLKGLQGFFDYLIAWKAMDKEFIPKTL